MTTYIITGRTYDVRTRLSGELEGSYSELNNALTYARQLANEFGELFEIWSSDDETCALAETYALVETVQPCQHNVGSCVHCTPSCEQDQ